MTPNTDQVAKGLDTGSASLALALRILGLPADGAAILQTSGKAELDETDLLRAARTFPIKARLVSRSHDRLGSTVMPCMAKMKNGAWTVLLREVEARIMLADPLSGRMATVNIDEFVNAWSGRLILLTRRESLSHSFRRFDLSWFMGAIIKYRHSVIEILAASFFIQLFGLLTPLFFQVIIDKVLVHRGFSTLEVLVIGLLALSVFDVTLSGLRTYLLSHTSSRVDVELGTRLFRHLFSLPVSYFNSRRVGVTISRVKELENIRQFIASSTLTLLIDLVFSVIFVAVLLLYSIKLTIIVALALPCYVLLSLGLTPIFKNRLNERFRQGSENQSFLVESVTGAETIKSMAVERVMERRWEEQLAGYVRASFNVSTINMFGSQTAALINKFTVVLIIFFGAKLVIDNHLTVGELVAFNMISSQLAAPVLRIAQVWQDFQQVRISVEQTGDILNTIPETRHANHGSLPAIRGDIALEDVSFRYQAEGRPVLQDISLRIPAGQVIGLVGSSGSGKSTLAKLIQRLYVPEAGRLSVDGQDLNLIDARWLRRQIGVVLQESVLFNRSIRDNIALASPGMPFEQIVAAAKLAGAHDFVGGLPEGYDTIIGERGASLSGGQRQRIAIARALIGNPRILIFDEATSALDYESEAAIQANMRGICAGRTVLLIAHRLSTLRGAHRIITLEGGRIIEDGDHGSLIKAGGRYAQLWGLQTSDFAAAS